MHIHNHYFILPVDKLILDRIGILMFKYNNGLLPDIINRLYVRNKDIDSHNTRSKNRLQAPTGSMYFTNTSTNLCNVLVTKSMFMFRSHNYKILFIKWHRWINIFVIQIYCKCYSMRYYYVIYILILELLRVVIANYSYILHAYIVLQECARILIY